MMQISEMYRIILYTLASVFLGALFGYLVERFILPRLRQLTKKTTFKYDDIITEAVKGLVTIWFALIGLSLAIQFFDFSEQNRKILHNISFSVIIVTVSIAVSRIVVDLIKSKGAEQEKMTHSTSIVANITRVVIFLVGALVILQTMGISVTPVLTALGVGGLAVALALQDTLTNLFAGIQVIASKQVRTGDFIRLESGEEGFITDITWRNTTIKAFANNIVIIPNAKLANAIIRNFSLQEQEVALYVEVGVSYDSDLEKVEKISVEIAQSVLQQTPGGVMEFQPYIRYHTFGDSAVQFTVVLRVVNYESQYPVKHAFIKALYQAFKSNQIEIPFPIRTVIHKNQSV